MEVPAKPVPRYKRASLVLAPFAAGYFLSYFFRTLNAVVAPRLEQELSLGPEALGWLTSAYFFGFALFQTPLGLLLDRFGPARVQSVLLLVAAGGSALFAMVDGIGYLIVARALIGVGVSGALMSAFMTITQLFQPQHRALANGCFLVFGGLGALTATGPLDLLLDLLPWRHVFLMLAAATAGVALMLHLRRVTSDRLQKRGSATGEHWREQLSDVAVVLRDRGFWRIAPLSALSLATIWSFQGLWTAFWLRDVDGLGQAEIVTTLSLMALCTIAGNFTGGLLSDLLGRPGIGTERIFVCGCVALQLVELILLFGSQAMPVLLWCVFSFLTGFATLAYAIMPYRFPRHLTGRTLTALNILSLLLAFLLQAVIGVVVEQWTPAANGRFPAEAYRVALGAIFALQAMALLHCLNGGKR